MINALRGMKDMFSPESEKYLYFIENCSKIAKNYGFIFISTPILEETTLFKRSVGESSDIVNKEMYQFIDKGNNDVCMRPEGTAGVVRAFVQAKMDKAGEKRRFFYYGSMFRYERPQKGRLRQFHQFGVESFGYSDVREDATIILMLNEMLEFFGIDAAIKLNSLGCPECMPSYKDKLVKFLDLTNELCEDCQRRKKTNPIRVLDCKNENCQKLLKNAPLLIDNLCCGCKNEFDILQNTLRDFNVKFEINPMLVRGLDYYSKTAFEFVSDKIGSQSSIAGGGRYDRLVEFLGGKPTNGVGFAIGIERLLELFELPESKRKGFYIGALTQEAEKLSYEIAMKLRINKKAYVLNEYSFKDFKSHLKNADKMNAKYFICIGNDELKENGELIIKDLETKDKKQVTVKSFLESL
ncbi:MAG: histidine--tRNA ligase [Campylobacteraceae bacterium]|jgi:histidyl-tRNA synthetase|nr:histidine--tRNA ligase [Campylobacteraceae bacterium]